MHNFRTKIPDIPEWETSQDYPLLPIRYYSFLLKLLESSGYEIEHILKRAQISRSKLNNPDARISWRQLKAIVISAYRQTRHPALGLYFGQTLTASDAGPIGTLLHNGKDIRESLKILNKYFKILVMHSDLELDVESDEAVIRIRPLFTDKIPLRFIFEMWAASWCGSTKLYFGMRTPLKYVFPYPAPSYAEVYNDVLRAPVEFNAEAFEIRFLADWLNFPLPRRTDSTTAKLAEKQCDKLVKVTHQYERLLAEIYRILINNPDQFPSLEQSAEYVGIAPRTLSRNLQLFGTSYKDVVDSVRMSLAIRYLKYTDLPIEEISTVLHYSDPSNFRRAFKKRTRKAPSHYRNHFHRRA